MTLSPASVLEYLLCSFLISRGQIWWESERCHTKLLWAHLHTHRQNSKPTVFSQGILFRNLPGKGVMKSQKICGVRQSIEREVRRSFLFVRLKRKNMWAWLSLSVQKIMKDEFVHSEESFKRCDFHHYDTFTWPNWGMCPVWYCEKKKIKKWICQLGRKFQTVWHSSLRYIYPTKSRKFPAWYSEGRVSSRNITAFIWFIQTHLSYLSNLQLESTGAT